MLFGAKEIASEKGVGRPFLCLAVCRRDRVSVNSCHPQQMHILKNQNSSFLLSVFLLKHLNWGFQ